MKLKKIIAFIEDQFPPYVQESYDNSGLITGNYSQEITGILLTIDVTESVIDEAISKNCNLIVAHHPVIFHPLKTLTGSNNTEKTVIKAIKNDIAIYAAHTSVDNNYFGLNKIVAEELNLTNLRILDPKPDLLYKIITFVPTDYAEKVRNAMFEAGAGHIGNYDSCSYNLEGQGTFRALENTNPFVGEQGELHFENETRIETIVHAFKLPNVIQAMKNAHPYEEVAYDVYPLVNKTDRFGSGIIGKLPENQNITNFLNFVKKQLNIKSLRYSKPFKDEIKKVAITTGAGHFLMNKAMSSGADVFISAEFRYDQYIAAQNKIVIVDAGHYETEIFIKKIFYPLLSENFTNFAVELSDFENPVNYL